MAIYCGAKGGQTDYPFVSWWRYFEEMPGVAAFDDGQSRWHLRCAEMDTITLVRGQRAR